MEVQVIETTKGKPSLIADGYRYRICRRFTQAVRWRCVKEGCKGSIKTSLSNEVIDSSPHDCSSNSAEIEVAKAKFICRKRTMEEVDTPVHVIYKQEFRKLRDKGYDLLNDYENSKTALCHLRRKTSKVKKPKTK